MDFNSTKNVNMEFMKQRLYGKALQQENELQERHIVFRPGSSSAWSRLA